MKKEKTTEIATNDDLRRLTVEECNELYLKHNNPNMRRLSDEEYAELYETMYGQKFMNKKQR